VVAIKWLSGRAFESGIFFSHTSSLYSHWHSKLVGSSRDRTNPPQKTQAKPSIQSWLFRSAHVEQPCRPSTDQTMPRNTSSLPTSQGYCSCLHARHWSSGRAMRQPLLPFAILPHVGKWMCTTGSAHGTWVYFQSGSGYTNSSSSSIHDCAV